MEQNDLIILAQIGDIEARNILIMSHMGIIGIYAHKYSNWKYPFEDLLHEGVLAAITAIDDYDITCGYKLTTIISRHVRNRLCNIVVKKSIDGITLKYSVVDYRNERINFNDYENDQIYIKIIDSIINTLKPSQKRLIQDRFWGGLSLVEVANKYNITKQAVFQNERTVINKINRILKKGRNNGTYP